MIKSMGKNTNKGMLCALVTIFIWGTTYVSTKVLLNGFKPIEILLIRFLMGYLALWVVSPKILRVKNKKQNLYFILAGLSGITFYYLLENIALVYTTASNVGIIISVAPFFTGILSWLLLKEEKPGIFFLIGFVCAVIGTCMISVEHAMSINPKGDLLALLAAIVWALYSILTKKINTFGYPVVMVTRRTFFFGILFMIPFIAPLGGQFNFIGRMAPVYFFNFLFLGLGASALCFVTWNMAVKILGAVKTSAFIYLVPIITVVSSVIVLHEHITLIQIAGCILTILGLVISGRRKMGFNSVKSWSGTKI